MKIAVLGLGAYGIALTKVLHNNDNKIVMWSKFKEEVDSVLLKRENIRVLPGVKIPKDIEITTNLEEAVEKSKIIILAVPTSAVRMVARELAKFITDEQILCIVSKGIEKSSNKLLSDVVFEETKSNNICMLTGPSFAIEIANGSDAGFVVASTSQVAGMAVKVCLENDKIVVNTTTDIIGAQICAATKNVFAILVGISDVVNKTDSCRAAVLTCVLNDLRIITELLGGKPHTVFTYAGVGDLLLTCMSSKSRNYTLGKYIGQGMELNKALEKMQVNTIEGLYTLDALINLLENKEIKIRSLEFLYDILYKNGSKDNILKYIKC